MKKSIQYKWLATASVKQNVSYGYEQYNKDERKSEAIGWNKGENHESSDYFKVYKNKHFGIIINCRYCK